MFCMKCGNQVSPNSNFCMKCGSPINNNTVDNDSLRQEPVPVPQSPSPQNIPVFTPPKAPVFTPPTAPIFEPPEYRGQVCRHHPNEPAVDHCARCGNNVCKDCAEVYTVSAGEYADQVLCFDCCEQLVSENISELSRNKQKIMGQFILMLIGMTAGFILGIGDGIVVAFICACIGGVFLRALKAFFVMQWEALKMCFSEEYGIVGACFFVITRTIVVVIQCVWAAITESIAYIVYLKRTSGFIQSDTIALQQMKDYMQYTLVRSNNKDIDLASLMNEGSELYNNSYARNVMAQGEEAADAALRQVTTQINERGEIIRSFSNTNRNANAA